nr:glycosyltransferase family 2 protein [Actinomycetota bacterium]
VIVLNWNGWRDTLDCLASLEKLDHPDYEVVVVDNGSTDGSEEKIREKHPHILLLQTDANLGFAGGNNVGIEHALRHGADYVWLLNNDTIADPEALSEMVALAESDERIGLVSSSLYYAHDPKSLQAYGGGAVNWWSGTNRLLKKPSEAGLDFLTGASLLIKRPVLESIGFLDGSYFFYWEDVAYSRRAVEAGWKLSIAAHSRIHHKEGGTVSGGARIKSLASDEHMIRSTIRFFGEYGGSLWPVPVLVYIAGMTVNRLRRRQADRILPLLVIATRACLGAIASKLHNFSRGTLRRNPE